MYFLIIAFGFMLAMRSTRPAPLQRPVEGLVRTWREAADLLLTLSLMLALWTAAITFEKTQGIAREYSLLGFGIIAYLLTRYQKKTDVFFLAALAIVFMIHSRQTDLWHGLSLADGKDDKGNAGKVHRQ